MKRIVIINGYPGAGKDTFVELCGKYMSVANILTSTPAKEALKLIGWNGEKTPKARKILADLMELSYREFNGPTKYVVDEVDRSFATILFVHCREPENIDRLKRLFGSNAVTMFIDREAEGELSNDSDKNVRNYNYDIIVDNNGSLEGLEKSAIKFLAYLMGGK